MYMYIYMYVYIYTYTHTHTHTHTHIPGDVFGALHADKAFRLLILGLRV